MSITDSEDGNWSWKDIELLALTSTEVRRCVELVRRMCLTKEQALIQTVYRLAVFREDLQQKVERALECNDIKKLL